MTAPSPPHHPLILPLLLRAASLLWRRRFSMLLPAAGISIASTTRPVCSASAYSSLSRYVNLQPRFNSQLPLLMRSPLTSPADDTNVYTELSPAIRAQQPEGGRCGLTRAAHVDGARGVHMPVHITHDHTSDSVRVAFGDACEKITVIGALAVDTKTEQRKQRYGPCLG